MRKTDALDSTVGIIATLGFGFYFLIHCTYFHLPREDIRFLDSVSSKSEVEKRFEVNGEELSSGAKFKMTGWYPLPDRTVAGSAFSVVRRYGSKIYLFFDTSGNLEEYFIATS